MAGAPTGSALVVEDHPLYRDALVHVLQPIFGASSVKAAGSAEEGLRFVQHTPDLALILLDPGLPGMNGFEAIAAFRKLRDTVPLVVISASDDRRGAEAALRAGAIAFVSKAASTEVVSDLVYRVCAGVQHEQVWINASGGMTPHGGDAGHELTARQREILELLCQGHPNKEIGLRLGLAEVTVKMHVSSIFRALGVANRTQAVLAARRLGFYSA